METKYYKFGKNYYRITGTSFEKITLYKHSFGIERNNYYVPDLRELEVITEAQYNRAKRLILKKLI